MSETPSVEAIDARVDSLQTQFHELDVKSDANFVALNKRLDAQGIDFQHGMQSIIKAVDEKFTRASDQADRNRPSIATILNIGAAIGVVILTIVGGFGKAELDPITERLKEHSGQIEHIRETTETRDELAARFQLVDLKTEFNKDWLNRLQNDYVPKGVIFEAQKRYDEQVTNLRDRLKTIETTTVSRADIDQMTSSLAKRQDLISNRVSEIAKDGGGDQLRLLTQEFQALQNKVLNPTGGTAK